MISIIMPSYNTAPWIGAAIRSVIAQTFTDWELIVIDDESTDNSREIVSAFSGKDPRIRLVEATHCGLAAIRNIGLAEAGGDFILFLDSDDLLPEWNLEYFMKILSETDADFVSGNYLTFKDGCQQEAFEKCSRSFNRNRQKPPRLLSGLRAAEESMYQQGINSSLWSKLFRRSLFDGIRLVEGELYEDLNIFYLVALRASKVAVSDLPVYLYRKRAGSILYNFNPKRLDVLKVTERMHDFTRINYPALTNAAIDRRFSANYNMLQEIARHRRAKRSASPGNNPCSEDDFLEVEKKIRAYLKKYAAKELKSGKVRFKNRAGALFFLSLPAPVLEWLLARL